MPIVKTVEAQVRKCSLIFASLIIALAAPAIAAPVDHPRDSWLFEKDGFRIRYAGAGNTEWIAIDGKIPPDADAFFKQYLVDKRLQGASFNITFNSEGGSLTGAIRLGRMIRKLGMRTSIGKTALDDSGHHIITKGVCYSACAYAFLGGVSRSVEGDEYGVHQFFTDALLKDPNGKVLSPVDFSVQQTVTGLLLSYVIEMGASAKLVVEANKTPPTKTYLLSKNQLMEFRVAFDPARYDDWKLKVFENGIVAYSQSQDEKKSMKIFCGSHGQATLLVTYRIPAAVREKFITSFKTGFSEIDSFSLLGHEIRRSEIALQARPDGISLQVPLTREMIQALETDKNTSGAFSVSKWGQNPRSLVALVYEHISLGSLAPSIRLAMRNCIN